ncbi:MAG: hypothetical protein Q8N57_01055 [bacterium]|nr:hypothetical protein [bacterium]
MFEKFIFSLEQIKRYYQAAARDFSMLDKKIPPEIAFYLCYNIIIKVAMAVCAKNNIRVKSRIGHHIELIGKLAEFLDEPETEVTANKIRTKRNRDLYDGGMLTSQKEADFYLQFCRNLMKKTDNYLFPDKLI